MITLAKWWNERKERKKGKHKLTDCGELFSTAYCDQYDNYRVRAYSGLNWDEAEPGII